LEEIRVTNKYLRRLLWGALSVAAAIAGIIGTLVALGVIKPPSATQVTRTYLTTKQDCPPPQGELCGAIYSLEIQTQSTLKVEITPSSLNCGSSRYYVYVDGVQERVTPFLGWPNATGADASLPTTSGLLDLSPVSPGKHQLGLQGEGRPGGCNIGRLYAFEVNVTVVTDS